MLNNETYFLIGFLGTLILIMSIIGISEYSDRQMYQSGFVWVPTIQGHWERPKAEVSK